jgi:hypothetical protein
MAPFQSLLMVVVAASTASAAGFIECPARIDVNQRLAAQIPGWSVVPSVAPDEMPHQLAGVTFFDGNPRERASLVPDKQSKLKASTIASWTFGVSDRAIWIACSYAWTSVVLSRPLPKATRTCSITYSNRDTIAGLPVIEKFDCKQD